MSSPPAPPLLPDLLPIARADVNRSAEGVTYLWQPAPHIVVTRVEGFFTTQAARAVDVAWRRAASVGRLLSFNDWEEMTDYDSVTRLHLTAVAVELRERMGACHVLSRSMTVRLGVQMASLAVKAVHMVASRSALEGLVREALRKSDDGTARGKS